MRNTNFRVHKCGMANSMTNQRTKPRGYYVELARQREAERKEKRVNNLKIVLGVIVGTVFLLTMMWAAGMTW